MKSPLQKLNSRLLKIEAELSTCRGSVLEDGWQTQRYANKMRKWDILAQEKMKLKSEIEEYKNYKCSDCKEITLCRYAGEILVGFCDNCNHPIWDNCLFND